LTGAEHLFGNPKTQVAFDLASAICIRGGHQRSPSIDRRIDSADAAKPAHLNMAIFVALVPEVEIGRCHRLREEHVASTFNFSHRDSSLTPSAWSSRGGY
jgi:hypothetical protein